MRPERFQVGPFEYAIEWDSAVADGELRKGAADFINHKVEIGRLCRGVWQPVTLLHEMIHAVEDAMGLDFEDAQITALSHGLAQALQSAGLYPKTFEGWTCEVSSNLPIRHEDGYRESVDPIPNISPNVPPTMTGDDT